MSETILYKVKRAANGEWIPWLLQDALEMMGNVPKGEYGPLRIEKAQELAERLNGQQNEGVEKRLLSHQKRINELERVILALREALLTIPGEAAKEPE